VLDKTPPDVPGGVVIAVELLPTLQTRKLITLSIVLVSESTFTVTTSLTRIRRSHVVQVDTVFFSFVFDVAVEFTERPLLEL
jgi:hypothetical protein